MTKGSQTPAPVPRPPPPAPGTWWDEKGYGIWGDVAFGEKEKENPPSCIPQASRQEELWGPCCRASGYRRQCSAQPELTARSGSCLSSFKD